MDLGTFNVHVLGSDIFTEIYTHTLNDLFHTVVKTNKINNIYFQFLREERQKKKNYQLKSISSLNPKQQTDLVNNFPEQMSSLAILPLLRLKKGGSSSRFIKSIFTDQLKAR